MTKFALPPINWLQVKYVGEGIDVAIFLDGIGDIDSIGQ